MGWLRKVQDWFNQDDGDLQFVPFEKEVKTVPVLPPEVHFYGGDEVRFYGGDGTIHGTTHLDIVTYRGQVVEVWFRCQTLPFKQSKLLDKSEAALAKKYPISIQPEIVGLFLVDPEQ